MRIVSHQNPPGLLAVSIQGCEPTHPDSSLTHTSTVIPQVWGNESYPHILEKY
jgi:hypothetical protein